jgi:hypothetical protein
LSGFCLRIGKRQKSFFVATSVNGEQFRMTLGRWPLLNTEDARSFAAEVLRNCRKGEIPARQICADVPCGSIFGQHQHTRLDWTVLPHPCRLA